MNQQLGGKRSRVSTASLDSLLGDNDVDDNVADTSEYVDIFSLMDSLNTGSTADGHDPTSNRSSILYDDDDVFSSLFKDFDSGGDVAFGTLSTASLLIDRYVAPIIVVVGLIGNVISLLVFSERTMRHRSSSVYLAALSAVDIAFLTCVLLSWTAQTRIDLYGIEGMCQTFTYVTYVSSFLGVWYVVGFTIERYVAVHYPLRRQSLCTTARARRLTAALAAFAAVAYSFGAWTSGVTVLRAEYRMCGPMAHYAIALTVVHAVDTVVTLLLPFVLITALNLRIAITVVRCNRDRRAMSRMSSHRRLIEPSPARVFSSRTRASVAAGNSPMSTSLGRRQLLRHGRGLIATGDGRSPERHFVVGGVDVGGGIDQFRVTKLLLTLSAVFLLFNLPRHAVRVYSFVVDMIHPFQPPSPVFLMYRKLFQVVYYLQFAVNVVLYATVRRNKFVGALRRIAHRSRRRLADAVTCQGDTARSLSDTVRQFTGRRGQAGTVLSSLQMVVFSSSRGTPTTIAAIQPDENSHVSLE